MPDVNSRIAVAVLVLIDRLCQGHVLVHEDDGEHLSRPACLVAIGLVEVETGMEANLACSAS